MTHFLTRIWAWLRNLPGEDGIAEYQVDDYSERVKNLYDNFDPFCDDPRDLQTATRNYGGQP